MSDIYQSVTEESISSDSFNSIINSELNYEIDYNDAARTLLSASLGEVPVVGFLLSAFVDIFWPSEEKDVWGEIKEKVEALIDKKISDLVYQQVSEDLEGLKNTIHDYTWAVKSSKTKTVLSEKFHVALGAFELQQPHFQSKGYELPLLPLFTQFANMYLSLLRDGYIFGENFGWDEATRQHYKEVLISSIKSFTEYVDSTYNTGLEETKKKAPSNSHKTEPFNTINKYEREMTITVKDFRNIWKYFDPVSYPNPVKVYLDREIYSDALGTADDNNFYIPKPPTQPIAQVEVWGWDRIDACQVTYPQGGGPEGITQTGRMGNQQGGSSAPPHGGTFSSFDKNPIVMAKARKGSIVNAMWFGFSDGSTSNMLGGNYPGGDDYSYSFTNHILSSIKIMGVSRYYGSADCVVFGFKFRTDSNTFDTNLIKKLYISSPNRIEPGKLASFTGSDDIIKKEEEIKNWIKNNHWDKLRELFWNKLENKFEAVD